MENLRARDYRAIAAKKCKPMSGRLALIYFLFTVNFVCDLFISLWTLLLIVPGIIKSLSYSMTVYIAIDDPKIGTLDAITKSRQMMNGYKWKLFCLNLSYIGWILLCILTLGILSFWVDPKMHQAQYQFYLNIKDKNK